MSYFQQGDVLLKQTTLPKKTKKIKTDLVHKGQNHHHRLKGGFVIHTLGTDMFVEAKKGTTLFHEEHKSISLPKGIYKKEIVVEYDHLLEESRQVID